MSNLQETNRVLGRVGARILSDEELQQIAAGFKISRSSLAADSVPELVTMIQ